MNKKNILKRLAIAMVVAAMLAVNMLSVISAAQADNLPVIDTTKDVSLTITKYEAEDGDSLDLDENLSGNVQTVTGHTPLKDVEFSAVRVADITQTSTAAGVQVQYTLTSDGAKLLNKTANDVVTATELNTWIKNYTASAFIADTNAYTVVKGKTDENGQVKFASDGSGDVTIGGQGLYLIVETQAPENVISKSHPFFVSLPMTDRSDNTAWLYDVYAYPKNATGTMEFDKKITAVNDKDQNGGAHIADDEYSASANINDKITFELPLTMIIPDSDYTKFEFTDTLSKGLTYQPNSVKVVRKGGNSDTTLTLNKDYTVTYTEDTTNAANAGTLKIAFTATYLENLDPETDGSEVEFSITYDAVLNEDAVLGEGGNKNSVKYSYEREDGTEYELDTPEETEVYTWGIDLLKEGESNAKLGGVEFTMSTDPDGDDLLYFVKDSGGNYYVPTASTTTGASTTMVTADGTGKLVIRGLDSGTYYLKETKTATGYVLLKDPITIVIDGDESDGSAEITVGGYQNTLIDDPDNTASVNALVSFTVVNSKGFNLPATGGAGTAIFTIVGVVVIILSASLLIMTRKKNVQKR